MDMTTLFKGPVGVGILKRLDNVILFVPNGSPQISGLLADGYFAHFEHPTSKINPLTPHRLPDARSLFLYTCIS